MNQQLRHKPRTCVQVSANQEAGIFDAVIMHCSVAHTHIYSHTHTDHPHGSPPHPHPLSAAPTLPDAKAAGREVDHEIAARSMASTRTSAHAGDLATRALPVADAHGFEVPRSLVSKYLAHQERRRGGAAAAGAAADWPSLLAQARSKRYRTGAALPPLWTAAVRAGVPTAHRGEAWVLLSGAAQRRAEHPGLYEQLLREGAGAGAEVADQIQRDLPRTFPAHPRLTPAFLGRLRNVLLAYAARNPEVAYCQGMNFVAAAVLLFVDDDADAFWLLAVIVEEVLVDHYVQSMLGHQVDQQARREDCRRARPQHARTAHPPFLLPFAGARAAGGAAAARGRGAPPRPRPLDALRHHPVVPLPLPQRRTARDGVPRLGPHPLPPPRLALPRRAGAARAVRVQLLPRGHRGGRRRLPAALEQSLRV